MDIRPHNIKMDNDIKTMPKWLGDVITDIVVNDIVGIVRKRVQNDSKDDEGVVFESFSKKRIGAYSAWWGEIREAKGFQTEKVDFTFSGDMWRDFGEKESTYSNGVITVVIGGTNEESQRKINENSEIFRRPIIGMSKQEIKDAKTKLKDAAIKIIKEKMGFK